MKLTTDPILTAEGLLESIHRLLELADHSVYTSRCANIRDCRRGELIRKSILESSEAAKKALEQIRAMIGYPAKEGA